MLEELYKPKLTATDIAKELKNMYPSIKEDVQRYSREAKEQHSNLEDINRYIYIKLADKYRHTDTIKSLAQEIKEGTIKYANIDFDSVIADVRKEIGYGYGDLEIYADNARPEVIEELKRLGFSRIRACTKGSNSVLDGIEWLQDRTIYIDTKCTGAKAEIESYQWEKDKRTGERLPKPIKVNDDAMDSIRYATEKFKTKKVFRVFSN